MNKRKLADIGMLVLLIALSLLLIGGILENMWLVAAAGILVVPLACMGIWMVWRDNG